MEVAAWVGAIAGAVLAVLAALAFVTNPVKKLRDSIDAVAEEGRTAHAVIGENIEKATERLRSDLGGRIDRLQTEMGNVRQELGKLRGAVEQTSKNQ